MGAADALVLRRVDDWVTAIRARDLDGVMALYAPDVVSFDVNPPLWYAGPERKRRAWQAFFEAFAGPIAYEVRDLSIAARDGLACVHSLNYVTGVRADGRAAVLWVRWTACFQRIGAVWTIVHDHVSVPAEHEHGQANRG